MDRILFYGFDKNQYLCKLYDLVSNSNTFESLKLGRLSFTGKDLLDKYQSQFFLDNSIPSLSSKAFFRFYLSIQRRRKNLEIHSCYNEWQISIAYFINYLKINKINSLIFENIPHEVLDLCLWESAKILGLSCNFLYQIGLDYSGDIFGKFIFGNNPYDLSDFPQLNTYKTLSRKIYNNDRIRKLCISSVEVKEGIKNQFFISLIRTFKLYLFNSKFNFRKLINWIFALITLKKSVIEYIRYLFLSSSCISIRKKSELDAYKPFIYFPLHKQPELTTVILGGLFQEQADAIILMAKNNLNTGINILVKENPTQDAFQRNHYFYKRILRYPNVKFVSTSISAEDLFMSSIGVATISGSSALEASMHGKRTFIFGKPWYLKCKAMSYYESDRDIIDFIDKLKNQNDQESIKIEIDYFLKTSSKKYCDGIVDSDYLPKSNLDIDETLQETANSILKEIRLRNE